MAQESRFSTFPTLKISHSPLASATSSAPNVEHLPVLLPNSPDSPAQKVVPSCLTRRSTPALPFQDPVNGPINMGHHQTPPTPTNALGALRLSMNWSSNGLAGPVPTLALIDNPACPLLLRPMDVCIIRGSTGSWRSTPTMAKFFGTWKFRTFVESTSLTTAPTGAQMTANYTSLSKISFGCSTEPPANASQP